MPYMGQVGFEQYFGNGVDTERGGDIESCADGGYLILGTNHGDDTGSGYLQLIKVDSNGIEQWRKEDSDFSLFQSFGYALTKCTNGGFAITGGCYFPGGSSAALDVFVMKIDSLGNEEWRFTKDSIDDNSIFSFEYGLDIVSTSDSNLIVTGPAGNDEYFVIKLDILGSEVWIDKSVGLGMATANALEVNEQEDIYVIGHSTLALWDEPEMFVAKYGENGNLMWEQSYPGWTEGYFGVAWASTIDSLGDLYLCGEGYYTGASNGQLLIKKIDSLGNQLWTYSSNYPDYSYGKDILLKDSLIVLAGDVWHPASGYNSVISTLDTSGTIHLDSTVAGHFSSSLLLDEPSILLCGTGNNDIYTIKLGSILSSITDLGNELNQPLICWPNPSNGGLLNISIPNGGMGGILEIIDESGRIVRNKTLEAAYEIVKIQMDNLPDGAYIIRHYSENTVPSCQKLIIHNR